MKIKVRFFCFVNLFQYRLEVGAHPTAECVECIVGIGVHILRLIGVNVRHKPDVVLPFVHDDFLDGHLADIIVKKVNENLSFEMLLDGAEVPAVVEGDWIVYTPAKDLPDGKHTVQVTVNRPDGKSVTRKWMFFIGESGETLYFGQIHAHTAE